MRQAVFGSYLVLFAENVGGVGENKYLCSMIVISLLAY